MFRISNNGIVTVTRGDSFSLKVFMNLRSNSFPAPYELQEGDIVYFGLTEPNQPFEHALIRKTATRDDLESEFIVVFNFSPEMTEYIMPGNYYYTIKLKKAEDDSVITIMDKRKFVIID